MCGDLLQIDKLNGVDYLIIFSKYYDLIKTLILTYNLEPAGSHGVWGLDDHFHLIYILGASQLVKFNELKVKTDINPNSVFNTSILKNMRSKNLFFNAISFIKKVKKGPFSEHSPMLYDILTTKTWDKITKGMIKMYYGEILSKYPVVQHFYFGNVLFPWIDKVTLKQLPESTPDDEEEEEIDKSEAEIAMHQIYHNRERELIKLANQRGMNKPSTTRLKKGSDITNTKAPWSV
ncbi:hypothetical protein CANARDRAFT_29453 [[Candida] arabinofermentans NRRL YB-2248]|uniref:Serine/threonine-protein phosphatase 2A activator n=1 Tax=[Candida] arabinofermentans NRRL YB-2248 TaxID=983967 RepID=A0A1E4SWW5_9ASCO|nr:hypothetical protein CANARDRAFT_29453 [[Candida] arabinofermentans NRRL YB-2248]